jgi:predicted deacylase
MQNRTAGYGWQRMPPLCKLLLVFVLASLTGCQAAIPSLPAQIGSVEPGTVQELSFTPTASTLPLTNTPAPTAAPSSTPTSTFTPTPVEGVFFSIGQSVQGRELEMVRFGSGPIRRMIVAGIHGGYEWNTTDLAYQLIDYLRQNPQAVPQEITLYILPSINPDGYARELGAAGRANANGVDLNRNWDAFWSESWSGVACWNLLPVSAGEFPFSEPETQALSAFLLEHPVDALISYHSAALGIFSGGKTDDPASQHLARALSAVSGYAYPPIDYGCEYTGQFIDWAILQGAAAVTIELTNHTDTDYGINLRVLQAFLSWSYTP